VTLESPGTRAAAAPISFLTVTLLASALVAEHLVINQMLKLFTIVHSPEGPGVLSR